MSLEQAGKMICMPATPSSQGRLNRATLCPACPVCPCLDARLPSLTPGTLPATARASLLPATPQPTLFQNAWSSASSCAAFCSTLPRSSALLQKSGQSLPGRAPGPPVGRHTKAAWHTGLASVPAAYCPLYAGALPRSSKPQRKRGTTARHRQGHAQPAHHQAISTAAGSSLDEVAQGAGHIELTEIVRALRHRHGRLRVPPLPGKQAPHLRDAAGRLQE